MAVILTKNGRPASPGNPVDVKIPLVVIRDTERAGRTYFCRVCALRGERTIFWEGEETAFARHVTACSNRHEDMLRGRSLRVKAPHLFDPEVSGDVELGKWISKNREALIEGRKKI